MAFTVDRAITGIQVLYIYGDFDCQCVKQVKGFLGTTAHNSRSARYCFFDCLGTAPNLSYGMAWNGVGRGYSAKGSKI